MKRWLMLLTMLGGVMLCAPPTGARAAGQGVLVPQPGLGAKFGSRDPFRCTSKAAPTTGLITPDMAGQYSPARWQRDAGTELRRPARDTCLETLLPHGIRRMELHDDGYRCPADHRPTAAALTDLPPGIPRTPAGAALKARELRTSDRTVSGLFRFHHGMPTSSHTMPARVGDTPGTGTARCGSAA